MTLQELKNARYEEIDQVNDYLFETGFEYDGVTFPMTPAHQVYYGELTRLPQAYFPLTLIGISNDGEPYSLDVAQRNLFSLTYLTAKVEIMSTGDLLKEQIYNAADEAEVEAIVDPRV